MGKRGPKPKPPEQRRGCPTSIRLTSALRTRLEAAAKRNGSTLSTEIATRLGAPFDTDGQRDRIAYNVKDIEQMLPVSRNAIYEAIRKGEIPSIRIGARALIPAWWVKKHTDPDSSIDVNAGGV